MTRKRTRRAALPATAAAPAASSVQTAPPLRRQAHGARRIAAAHHRRRRHRPACDAQRHSRPASADRRHHHDRSRRRRPGAALRRRRRLQAAATKPNTGRGPDRITSARCRQRIRTRCSAISQTPSSVSMASNPASTGAATASSCAPRVPDGKLADYEISYTFGVYPLQQYLIAFPGGRYQALSIAWDSRPKEQGGQRWFHLQPERRVAHDDALHWTGNYQNWALQCAECHSTNLRKGYDAASHSYRSTYSEINVACEACHGPVRGMSRGPAGPSHRIRRRTTSGCHGSAAAGDEAWKFPADGARVAVRDKPSDPAGMNVCAPCHARRATLSEERRPGAVLEDSHRLAMLTAPNYHADGQQREEVYVWASFLQSRMQQSGVTCMDCHEPHSLRTRAAGNALCNRCHNAAEYDAPGHHRHVSGSKGAQCINCHMPTQNYMVIHARQDHSLRVPRPDLSLSLGTPNACNQCHVDRKPEWAASAMDRWYGRAWRDRPSYGPTLHAGATRGILALPDSARPRTQPGSAGDHPGDGGNPRPVARHPGDAADGGNAARGPGSPAAHRRARPARGGTARDAQRSRRAAALGSGTRRPHRGGARARRRPRRPPRRRATASARRRDAGIPGPRSIWRPTGRRAGSISASCVCARGAATKHWRPSNRRSRSIHCSNRPTATSPTRCGSSVATPRGKACCGADSPACRAMPTCTMHSACCSYARATSGQR
jgi:hypothetical protein